MTREPITGLTAKERKDRNEGGNGVFICILCVLSRLGRAPAIASRASMLMCAASLAGSPLELWAAELPRLFPDYIGVTLPPNIAPLNFRIQEPAASYRVELRSTKGPPIVISSPDPAIRIPPKAWASLLHANPGQPFFWDISAQTASAGWARFATVTNHIAREEIDGWLAYRLLKPIFNFYTHLGIYQRNLESFNKESSSKRTSSVKAASIATPRSTEARIPSLSTSAPTMARAR